jgi:hypothetical protein
LHAGLDEGQARLLGIVALPTMVVAAMLLLGMARAWASATRKQVGRGAAART